MQFFFDFGQHLLYRRGVRMKFTIFYINIYIALQWNTQKCPKIGQFWWKNRSEKKSNKTSQKLYIFMTFGHFWSKAIVLELYEKSQKWQKWPFSAVFIKLQNHRLWSKMIKRHENLSIPSSFNGFFVRNNFIFVIGRFLDIFVFFTVKLYRYLYRK